MYVPSSMDNDDDDKETQPMCADPSHTRAQMITRVVRTALVLGVILTSLIIGVTTNINYVIGWSLVALLIAVGMALA